MAAERPWSRFPSIRGKIRAEGEPFYGQLHGPDPRAEDIGPVDLLSLHPGYRPGQRTLLDEWKERLPFFFCQLLGVIQAGDVRALGQDHRRGVHRSGQRSSPRLVTAADPDKAGLHCFLFILSRSHVFLPFLQAAHIDVPSGVSSVKASQLPGPVFIQQDSSHPLRVQLAAGDAHPPALPRRPPAAGSRRRCRFPPPGGQELPAACNSGSGPEDSAPQDRPSDDSPGSPHP